MIKFGYHTTEIPKGEVGEFSKIKEEVLELEDALAQGNKIMALNELADIYLAMEMFLAKGHFNACISMVDIEMMARATREAFRNGSRR